MDRRAFISGIAGGFLAAPLAAEAQQAAMPVIAFLALPSRATFGFLVDAFRLGLGDAGYVEGKSVTIEYRWADNQTDRVPALAADLVRGRVAVTVAVGSLAVARLVAVLMNPTSPDYGPDLRELQDAARAIGQRLLVLNVSTVSELAATFDTLVQRHARALIVMTDVLFNSRRQDLVALTAHHAVPMVHVLPEAVTEGGLMSYGANIPELYRHIGAYTGRILKGERPGDLPVLQPTKIELVINLKTAKALGLTIPPSLLQRADHVIE